MVGGGVGSVVAKYRGVGILVTVTTLMMI